MVRTGSGDRIILFTMVDLLLQIIFFAFLLFAVNRASQGNIQDRLADLARKFGLVSVTRFLDATSKLVAISELGRIDSVAARDDSKLLDDATKIIEGLDRESLRRLSALDAKQFRTFLRLMARLSPAQRAALTSGLTPRQLRALLDDVAKLPDKDRASFIRLSGIFAKADPNKRQKIVDESATIAKPICFGGRQALEITEVAGGYRVRALLPGIGGGGVLGTSAFEQFAGALNAAHADCTIRVRQLSETNDERQLKTIQYYFLTF